MIDLPFVLILLGVFGLVLGIFMFLFNMDRDDRIRAYFTLGVSVIAIVVALIISNSKGCDDYDVSDYSFGRVPVKCADYYKVKDLKV